MAIFRPYDLTDGDRDRLRDIVRRGRLSRAVGQSASPPGPAAAADADELRRWIDRRFTREGNLILTEVYLASRAALGHEMFYRLRREIDRAEGR